MEEQTAALESLYEKMKEYVNINIELAKLKAVDKTSDIVSSLVPKLLTGIFLFVFLFIVNIALSLWLGEVLGKNYYGFLAVAGFYLLVAIIVHYALSASIKKNIANAIISRLLN